MKAQPPILLLLVTWLAVSHQVVGVELSGFGPLPNLGKNWKLQELGTNGSASDGWAWAVFANSQTGDLMSFGAQRFGNNLAPKVDLSGPWMQTVSETFVNGRPIWLENPASGFLINWIHYGITELSVGNVLLKTNLSEKALEYSIVFEERVHGHGLRTNRLAHGYGLAFGTCQVVVQHTSKRVITSEDAHAMASSLISIHAHQEAARNEEGKAKTPIPEPTK